jgi:cellulose synthase/poly-beta-1,6-N-acetylglucosamine synthase-like glycosyltransferase
MTRGFAKIRHPASPKIDTQRLTAEDVPFVSILLPVYKEPVAIVKQTLHAALDLAYPPERYEIVVAEDTPVDKKIQDECEKTGIRHISRSKRTNFKAGAVNNALPQLKGQYVLFIDADHILEKNIITNCLLAWRQDSIGVQTRIDFVNMQTYLTKVSVFLQIQFFSLFQRARRASGSAIFAGGAALFHRSKLLELGGLNPLTIADDTDTSFLVRAQGYRIEYIDIIGAWALVPWDPLHLIRQVWRWLTGITRSFRARWRFILRSKTPFYVKVDHVSTSFFPTLAVLGWLLGFLIIMMVQIDVPIKRTDRSFGGLMLVFLPSVISVLPFVTGIGATVLDNKQIKFHKTPLLSKIFTIFGFYLLIIAAQPLLIGAVLKGLIGSRVSFNRTPKEKEVGDTGLDTIKMKYLIYSVVIFIIGIVFLYFSFQVPIDDPRGITLIIGAYAGMIPLIIALLWYWKLESYLQLVNEISAIEMLSK